MGSSSLVAGKQGNAATFHVRITRMHADYMTIACSCRHSVQMFFLSSSFSHSKHPPSPAHMLLGCLQIYHVVDEASSKDWSGGKGRVSKEIVQEQLPPPSNDHLILVCGPPPVRPGSSKASRCLIQADHDCARSTSCPAFAIFLW